MNAEQKCAEVDRLVECPETAGDSCLGVLAGGGSGMDRPGLRWRHNKASIRDYTVAVLSPAVALGLARWPDLHLESAPVSLFLCAVMLSAWLGGVGPGLLATVLSAAAFAHYFVHPFEMPRLVVFVLAAVLVGSLSATQRSSLQSLRKAEEALRETQAALARVTRVMMMGELAASIAHEVNQPLAGVVINGNACLRWLAGESPNLAEAREAAQRIIRDGTRASEIIARIRALAKKTSTPTERVDLNEAIREVLALSQGEARKHDVALRTQLPDDLPPVRGDRVLIQQVVLNLVVNGIEAMQDTQHRPRELVIQAQGEAQQVRVMVRDSGIGLDPRAQERIFGALYTTKPGGLGMGLSISRTIVENHGGRLSVVARDGPGATFEFTLPAYR
jgi:signal transduction histidine kinase